MNQGITESLYLQGNINKVDASQAIALGDDNAVRYEVWMINAPSLITAGGLVVTLQGSDDLEKWENESTYSVATLTSVPSTSYLPSTTPSGSLSWRYVRLKYQNTSPHDLLVGAAISSFKRYF